MNVQALSSKLEDGLSTRDYLGKSRHRRIRVYHCCVLLGRAISCDKEYEDYTWPWVFWKGFAEEKLKRW